MSMAWRGSGECHELGWRRWQVVSVKNARCACEVVEQPASCLRLSLLLLPNGALLFWNFQSLWRSTSDGVEHNGIGVWTGLVR